MVVGILRKILGGRPAWDYEEGYQPDPLAGVPSEVEALIDEVIVRLKMVRDELEKLKYKVTDEINAYFAKYKRARMTGSRDEMEVAAAEIVLKKKVLKMILAYIKLLDLTIARVHDAKDVNTLAKSMLNLSTAMNLIQAYLAEESPEMVAKMSTTIIEAQNVVRTVGQLVNSLPQPQSVAQLDPEIKQLLAMSFREANEEAEEIVPKLDPVAEKKLDYDKLEARLLDYIRANNGVLKVREAAAYLGVSPAVVKEVLYRLQKKGVIKISGGGQASTA